MRMVVLISLMGLVTFIPRAIPAFCLDRFHLSKRFEMFLKLIPYTALTAMVFPAILSVGDTPWIGVLGGLFAIVCAWKDCPTILVVIATIAFVFVLYSFDL